MASRLKSLVTSLVEATATPYPVDRYLEFVSPMLTWREHRAQITHVTRRTDRTVTVHLQPTRGWDGHVAGQYIEVSVIIDGVRHRRYFSPAGAEKDRGQIELTVTAHDGGFVSTHLRENAAVGDVLTISAAAGEFTLPAIRPASVVLVSGGSGITPVISMLRTLVAEHYDGPIDFVHYARTEADLAYRVELEAIARTVPNVRLHLHYTRTDADGRFTDEHLAALTGAGDAEIFLCGPSSLMSAVRDYADRAGLTGRLHSEAFTVDTAPVLDPNEPVTGTVAFTASGTEAPNDGRTLLEQAENAGLNPEFGCRMGICFSCTKVRTSGCTRNILTGELDSEPDQHIQICVNAPVGDVEIEV
ncbi:ferredoxin reductase [Gordonia sp. VNK21]|uniref:ferredoxin reductase n=1 Tax=Gordonia sp. VNK21 TaxID=3382483 RepID=UPI0038D41F24